MSDRSSVLRYSYNVTRFLALLSAYVVLLATGTLTGAVKRTLSRGYAAGDRLVDVSRSRSTSRP